MQSLVAIGLDRGLKTIDVLLGRLIADLNMVTVEFKSDEVAAMKEK